MTVEINDVPSFLFQITGMGWHDGAPWLRGAAHGMGTA